MLTLTKGTASETIVLTLNEKRTLDTGYYLLVFTHSTTREVVTKIFNFTEDESSYQARYNQFTIGTSVLFASSSIGDWVYRVYEQASSSNTDPTGLTELENGILVLNPASEFSFEEYTGTTTFKAYNG